MALIPGALNLTFISNYVGCHRLCFRIQGDPAYDCTTQVNCGGNGASCAVVIGIQIDDSSCEPITYEGYAQACCEDILSLEGRLPFTLTYTPSANCQGYTITCIGPVSVAAVITINQGSGYLPAGGTLPVTFTPALGGVAATAYIGDGGVSDQFGAVNVFPFGSLYVDGVYNNVPGINSLPQLGVGIGAQFLVTVAGGQVISATIEPTFNGSGYVLGDTVTFGPLGGGGSGAIATISLINTGQIENIVLTNPGSGYTAQPTATLPAPPAGVQATMGAAMGTCAPINIDTCESVAPVVIDLPLNMSFVSCNSTPYVLPADYTSEQTGCCNTCSTMTFTKDIGYTNPPATVYYISCATKLLTQVSLVAGGSISDCMVDNSWFVVESDPINGVTLVIAGPAC
jgi:hypothetical protein